MKTRIFICLGIIFIIFIILNYCTPQKEEFIVPSLSSKDIIFKSHTETFNIQNLINYFFTIHNFDFDLDFENNLSLLNYKVQGGIIDIHFRHLLNIGEQYIRDKESIPQVDEVNDNSYYLITNMANFMFYNKILTTKDEDFFDIHKYLIIIKNPILSKLNEVLNAPTEKDLKYIKIIKFLNKDNTLISLDNLVFPLPIPPLKNTPQLKKANIFIEQNFSTIYKGITFTTADDPINNKILLNLHHHNYFENIDNYSIAVLNKVNENRDIEEIYRYQFEFQTIPNIISNAPITANIEDYDYQYSWRLYSEKISFKNSSYFVKNKNSAFNLKTLDIYQICLNNYSVNVRNNIKKLPPVKNNCEPQDCIPGPSECENKQDVYKNFCLEASNKHSLFYLLLYFTNYSDLELSYNNFFRKPDEKLNPIFIKNFTDNFTNFKIFRVLLFYKIFKYEKYKIEHISKISNIISILLKLKSKETYSITNTIYGVSELLEEKMENGKNVDVISLQYSFGPNVSLKKIKKRLGKVLQNIINRETEYTEKFQLPIDNTIVSQIVSDFFRCNKITRGDIPNTKAIGTKIKFYLNADKLTIYLQVGDEEDEIIYTEETNNVEFPVINYSSKKKLKVLETDMKDIINRTYILIKQLQLIKKFNN